MMPPAGWLRRAAEHRRMPWKNGQGMTTELAVFPEGAGLDGFDWRISMAEVAADGPFSAFPGISRTLVILEGAGMTLALAGMAPVRLDRTSPPLRFAADQPCDATLVAGPIADLNVMTRDAAGDHAVERLLAGCVLDAPALLFVARGSFAAGDLTLDRHDLASLAAGTAIQPRTRDAVAYRIRLAGPRDFV